MVTVELYTLSVSLSSGIVFPTSTVMFSGMISPALWRVTSVRLRVIVFPTVRPVTLNVVLFPLTKSRVWNAPASAVPAFWIVALTEVVVGYPVDVTDVTFRSGARPITVTSAVVEVTPPAEAVTFVLPVARPVNNPFALMVPTVSSLLDQVTDILIIVVPFWSRRTAVNCRVSDTLSWTDVGETVSKATTGVSTLKSLIVSVLLPYSLVAMSVTV